MALERNFCASQVILNVTVEELKNINKTSGTTEPEATYFEF